MEQDIVQLTKSKPYVIKMENCEHELNITDEEWLDEEEVRITVKCDLCKKKFRGILK